MESTGPAETDYIRSTHHEFLAASDKALRTPSLQIILGQLGDTLGARNREAWRLLPNSDLVRQRARQIKDETLANLHEHLQTLEASVQARGGRKPAGPVRGGRKVAHLTLGAGSVGALA